MVVMSAEVYEKIRIYDVYEKLMEAEAIPLSESCHFRLSFDLSLLLFCVEVRKQKMAFAIFLMWRW